MHHGTLICILVAGIGLVACYPSQLKQELFGSTHVFLAVSSEASVDENGDLKDRLLEIHWYNIDLAEGGWIGLFAEDPQAISKQPSTSPIEPILRIEPTTESGMVKTSSRFDPTDFTQANLNEIDCVGGYWVAFFTDEGGSVPVITNCMHVYPHWMENMKDVIGSRRLTDILIPGTHDALSYKNYAGIEDELDLTVVYAYNQEDNIYSQLVHGIRFFDVRYGRFPYDPNELYWIVHGEIRTVPLSYILPLLKKFLSSTQEIVIFAGHNGYYNFTTDEQHDELMKHLHDELGEFLYDSKSNPNPTLNEIWASGKRLWLTYPLEHIVDRYDFLHPHIPHLSGGKNTVGELEEYLHTTLPEEGCQGKLEAAMAVMTPNAADVVLRSTFGLRGMAQAVNGPVSSWFLKSSLYDFANIVASDFYLGNNIIEMSMVINQAGGTCLHVN